MRPYTPSAAVLVVLAATLFVAGPARAEHPDLYFGGALGEADDEILAEASDAWTLYFGTRAQYVGSELAYHDLGDYVFGLLEQEALSVTVTGYVPFGEHFELLVRAGIAFWIVDIQGLGSINGDSLTWGGGAQYSFGAGERFAVRAEFERITDIDESDVDIVSVGFQVQF